MDKEQAVMESTNFWENPDAAGKPIDVVAFLTVFLRRWPFIVLSALFGFLLAAGISFLLTPQFTARAVFMPPSQQPSSSDNPLALFLKPPTSNIYPSLLLSDSVLTDVIQHSNLQAIYKAPDIERARDALRKATQVANDSNGFITLQFTDKDPHLAQAVANNFLAALSRLNDRLAISEAEQHRVIFQAEFERAKNDLEKSEVELKKAQEASGVVSPDTQIKSGLSSIDLARADIRARQIELAALLKGETEQSSNVQRLRSEIATEEAQLARLESGATSGPGGGLSAAQAPSVSLRFVELEREVKYNQVLFDVMAKQYENAKLQESSAAPAVQVVDYPELPLHKSKPSRTLIAIAGFFLGLLFAAASIFIRNRAEVLRQDPLHVQAVNKLRNAISSPRLAP